MTTCTPLRNARLMHGMAEKLGVDVMTAQASGQLDPVELRAMVERCDACVKHDDCILWMLENDTGADAAPGFCLNAEELGEARR